MEFPQIGQQCNEITCKQLDFLPLKCKCQTLFCSEHLKDHLTICPALTSKNNVELKQIEEVYHCSHTNCKTTSIIPLICEKCNKHFCVSHRHIVNCNIIDLVSLSAEKEKLEAPVKQFNKAKLAVDMQLYEKLSNSKKNAKSLEMANKIELMRIKNKASGSKSIPSNERIYFNVKHSKSNGVSPIFVSRTWTVGKAIDAIAQECKIQNDNNKSTALKLRLFKEVDGNIISQNMSDKIEMLITNKTVINGETLKLVYVENNCSNISVA